jgi:uncharacterized protein YvpB
MGKFTSSGHYVLVVGYDDKNNFVVDDPYGDWNKNYVLETLGKGGKKLYDIEKIDKIYTNKIDGKYLSVRAYKN